MEFNPKEIYWYDDEMLTYNCLFNFVVGVMGGGKTYRKKVRCVRNGIAGKGEFIYLRRTEKELKEASKKFADDLADEFPDKLFKVSNNEFYYSNMPENGDAEEWILIGTFRYLSGSRTQKSVAMPKVKDIIFDEFIIPTKKAGMYLPDEVTTFLEFYESVSRLRDVRVWFLSNALTKYNPYFLFWRINPPKIANKIYRLSPDMCIEMVAKEKYIEYKKQTRFGRIVKGTDFEKYAYENQFVEDDVYSEFVKKSKTATYYFTLGDGKSYYGIYKDKAQDMYIASKDKDMTYPLKYEIISKNGKVNKMVVKQWKNNLMLKNFFEAFMWGLLRFEDGQTMGNVLEMFRKIM